MAQAQTGHRHPNTGRVMLSMCVRTILYVCLSLPINIMVCVITASEFLYVFLYHLPLGLPHQLWVSPYRYLNAVNVKVIHDSQHAKAKSEHQRQQQQVACNVVESWSRQNEAYYENSMRIIYLKILSILDKHRLQVKSICIYRWAGKLQN